MPGPILALLEHDDLNPDMQRMADVVGMDLLRAIITEFHGERLDITGLRTLSRLRERYILERWSNASDRTGLRKLLARECDCSVRTVERILSANRHLH